MGLQDMISGYKNARIGGGGNYLKEGKHVLRVEEVKWGNAPNGGFEFFVVSAVVVETNRPDNHTVGDRIDWMVAFKTASYHETYWADVKQFLRALIRGWDPDASEEMIHDEKVLLWTLGEQQPFTGKLIGANAYAKQKRGNPQQTFTKVDFEPVTEPGWVPKGMEAPQPAA